jgi:hypothetical protein
VGGFGGGPAFLRKATVQDVSILNPGTSAQTLTLAVPAGIKVWALIRAGVRQTGAFGTGALFSSLDANDEAPDFNNSQVARVGSMAAATELAQAELAILTNTNRQIRGRIGTADTTNATLLVRTIGWIDLAEV